MLTRRPALDLLARFIDPRGAGDVSRALGFLTEPAALDEATSRTLGIPIGLSDPRIAVGRGALRALLVRAMKGCSLRALITRLSQRLLAHAPHQLWIVIAVRDDGAESAVAAWREVHGKGGACALLVDPRRLLDSDAETLMAMHAAGEAGSETPDTLLYTRWCEILGRDALSHRFYRALERGIVALGEGARGRADEESRRELALLTTSRLLFLSFLQGKGWLDGDADFLARRVDAQLSRGGDLHRRLFEPLFFGTLNTRPSRRAAAARAFGRVPFLNGGLFARSPLECRHRTLRFRDEEVAALFDEVLTRYRFTAREERPEWSEAAIDPEMLGRAFESLMASRERRDSGAYYTPQALVARVSDAAIDEALASAGVTSGAREALRAGVPLPADEAPPVREALLQLRILDPACGTGAFLVHILERLASYLQLSGDDRPTPRLRRSLLTGAVFGVDVNPTAVWLCELRLWLSVVIDIPTTDPADVPPLPNLDRNVRVGDALAGGALGAAPRVAHAASCSSVGALRAAYSRATGARKRTLARRLDSAERREAIDDADRRVAQLTEERLPLVAAARGRDLFGGRRGALGGERRRLDELRALLRSIRSHRAALARGGALPFRFASHFADVAAAGGFGVVVGNPPWVRLHRIPADRREALRREFRVFRDAAWKRGADDAAAGTGFAAQVDLAALFTERGLELLRGGGVLAFLLPIKLWRSLAGGGVRRLLGEHDLAVLEDWSEAPSAFDAAVYPSLVVARRRGGARGAVPHAVRAPATPVRVSLHRRDLAISWCVAPGDIALDDSPGAPWLLLPPEARAAFARLAAAGPPLAESGLGRPTLGVKSGCNAAFLVHESSRARGDVTGEEGRTGIVEPALLRPVLRGQAVRRWSAAPNDERIVWTHDDAGRALRVLPPLAARWLAPWHADLARRADARSGQAWWALFRVEGASCKRPRVVWSDLGRGPRACVLVAGSGWIPLNSCYVLPCRDDADAAAFAALLNSPLAAGWLDAVAEPARGGFRRYLGWTVARLPIPSDWARARDILAPLGRSGVAGETVSDADLLDAAIAAYRVRASAVRPLVEWTWR